MESFLQGMLEETLPRSATKLLVRLDTKLSGTKAGLGNGGNSTSRSLAEDQSLGDDKAPVCETKYLFRRKEATQHSQGLVVQLFVQIRQDLEDIQLYPFVRVVDKKRQPTESRRFHLW
nr:hypothetical protein BaRGS_025002 [Batillaria attramentaria]